MIITLKETLFKFIFQGKNINKIFSLSKDYIVNNNKILIDEEKEFIEKINNTQRLIQFYIKENL